MDLKRVETYWPETWYNWGDAFYIKRNENLYLTIATNKYIQFVEKLYSDISEKFLPGAEINCLLFTDHEIEEAGDNVRIHYIDHEQWPMPTLKRYNYFVKEKLHLEHDYCFYFDADMRIDNPVGEEVLADGVVATKHPYQSFNSLNDMSYDHNPDSLAYIPMGEGNTYFAGGFNGGKTESFIEMAEVIANNVNKDLEKGIVALCDESHMNRYLIDNPPSLELTPHIAILKNFMDLIIHMNQNYLH